MGAPYEFNYILRLRQRQGLNESQLQVGERFSFTKEGHRIYPVDVPIELANEAWDVIGRVAIREFTVGGGKTRGQYEVLVVYGEQHRQVATQMNRAGEEQNHRARHGGEST